jgi:hypothetical protein
MSERIQNIVESGHDNVLHDLNRHKREDIQYPPGDVSTCGPGGRNITSPGFALASDEKENISSILAAVSPPLVEEFLRLLGFTTSVYKS